MKQFFFHTAILIALFCLCFKAGAQNQTVNNGGATSPVNFPGTGCVYNWVNDTPGIGLPASGTGNIASFTAVNTGSSPVKATITATPVAGGFAYVPNSADGTVSVVNTTTNAVVSTIQVGSFPFAVAISPDGSRVYITNEYSKSVSVINTADNTVMATVTVGTYPDGVAVSPDGTRAYVTNNSDGVIIGDNTVSVINTLTDSVITTVPVGPNPLGVSVSPNGALVYVANSNSNTVSVIQAATNLVLATISVGTHPFGVCFSPDGSTAYVTNHDSQSVSVINTATNNVIATINVGLNPYGICSSPDGKNVYVANLNDNTVSVINTASNSVTSTIPVGGWPYGICISRDGNSVYVVTRETNSISTINTATNTVSATTIVGSSPYSFGNFITPGTTCTGSPVTFTVTVRPTSAIPDTISAGTATGTISACAGTASSSPNIQQFTVSGNGLTGNITATAPVGFELSLSASGRYNNSVTITQAGDSVSSSIVFVRSAASAPAGSISGNVLLTSPGAASQNVAVTGTVNALPTVNPVSNQTVNNGTATTAVNFTGTGNAFSWTNDTPGIGLAASGTGNIASFTAVNTGSSPVIATVTATPVSVGFAYITSPAGNNVSVINTVTNTLTTEIPVGSSPLYVAASPDGSRVYITDEQSNSVSVISTATNTVTAKIPVGEGPTGLTVSPDGSKVYVCDDDSISVISAATNAVVSNIPVGVNPLGIAVSPDGKLLYVANSGNDNVLVVSTVTNTVIATIAVGQFPNAIIISHDGSFVYVANTFSNTISVINTATNMVSATIPVGTGPWGMCLSPDGSRLYESNSGDSSGNSLTPGTVSVINTANNAVMATVAVGTYPIGISVTPDGSEVYVVNDLGNSVAGSGQAGSGTVSVINTTTNKVIATVNVGNAAVSAGNFIVGGTGCTGTPITFSITVNPTSAIPDTIKTSSATGTITACEGAASSSPNIRQFTVSGSGLTGNINVTAPDNFEVSLSATGGYGNSVTLTAAGDSAISTIVYVRSAASAPAGSISGNVVLTSPGAASQTVAVTGTVNALPTVNPVSNQTVNNGAATAAINFTGTGNTFTWTNDTPGIGLPASGTGNISSFTAVNTGSFPVTATITVTPVPDTSAFLYVPNTFSGTVSVIRLADDTVIKTIQAGNIATGVSVSPDGSRAYVTNWADGTVSVINTSTNTTIATIPLGLNAEPTGIVVGRDGSRVYVTNNKLHNVSVIDALTNSPIGTITVGSLPYSITISADGELLYVTNSAEGTVSVINTTTDMVVFTIPVDGYPKALCLSRDGSTLYVANYYSNNVLVINTSGYKTLATVTVGSPYGVVVSPDGSRLYVTNINDNTVSVINTITDSVLFKISVGSEPNGESLSQDGSRLYVTNDLTSSVSVISTAANAVIATIPVGINPISFGNAIKNGTRCAGQPITFTITVDPYQNINQSGIIIPNTFTPNGDGINDTWEIKNLITYQNCTVNIYSRYGEKLFSSTGYGIPWDGTYRGAKLPQATYYYIINLENGLKALSGFVTIVR